MSVGDAVAPIAPATPSRAEAFRYWLKLGFVSFGGPAGQIAIMHHDLVDRKHWISERRFLHALNYCMMSGPGVVSPSARPSIICSGVSQA